MRVESDDDEIARVRQKIAAELAREHAVEPARRPEPADFVWIEDEIPSGARPLGDSPWRWAEKPDHPVYSGQRSSMRSAEGRKQHYFIGASPSLRIGEGDRFFAYVYLPPASLPKGIMLQWLTEGPGEDWQHRAFWGEDVGLFGDAPRNRMLAIQAEQKVESRLSQIDTTPVSQ